MVDDSYNCFSGNFGFLIFDHVSFLLENKKVISIYWLLSFNALFFNCCFYFRFNIQKTESSFGLYSKTDRTQLTDVNSSNLSKRKVSSFKLSKSSKGISKNKKSSTKKNTAKLGFFHSFRVNGPMHPASRLNQPQQYEATIN
jgi:hypothetical protein